MKISRKNWEASKEKKLEKQVCVNLFVITVFFVGSIWYGEFGLMVLCTLNGFVLGSNWCGLTSLSFADEKNVYEEE